MIQRMNHLALRAADPEAAASFAVEKLGFTLVHAADDGTRYLAAHGVDPYSLVYVPGPEPGMDHLSYIVADVEAAAAALAEKGVEIERVADHEWERPRPSSPTTPASAPPTSTPSATSPPTSSGCCPRATSRRPTAPR